MSFQQLYNAATLIRSDTDPLHLVHEWNAKREALTLQIHDLPFLVSEFKKRKKTQHPTNPYGMLVDNVPSLRLSNACESTCHGLYSMAEVAASFANKISGVLPSSFNQIRKKVRQGEVEASLIASLSDLEWYERVREVRTEWTHHSSVFIGETKNGEPTFVVRSHRRSSDKEHLPKNSSYAVSEISQWTLKAIALLDSFGTYLLKRYVIPSFDLDAKSVTFIRDCYGFPKQLEDGRLETETVTVREHLTRLGVEIA